MDGCMSINPFMFYFFYFKAGGWSVMVINLLKKILIVHHLSNQTWSELHKPYCPRNENEKQ